jgi:hypothetical protein
MPLKLSAIQKTQEDRDIVLDFGDAGSLNMTVRPSQYTIGHQRQLKKAIREKDVATQADLLFAAVVSWDMTDEEGEVLPLDESSIDQLTQSTVLEIALKMGEALGAPKAETSNA